MSQILGRKTAKQHEEIFNELKRLERVEKRKKRLEERKQPYLHIGDKKIPIVGGRIAAPDLLPSGPHYLHKGKWKPILEALRGTLVRKGTKLAYKLATKKFPTLFKKKRFSIAELKAKKIKTPQLASLGVTKTTANNLRKLSVAEVIKNRLTKLGNMAIKHQRKAVSLFWGKAKNFNQIEKLEKYHMLATKKKLTDIGKQYANLTKYQETIKAKTATKHSEGGEVVISKNVDRSLL